MQAALALDSVCLILIRPDRMYSEYHGSSASAVFIATRHLQDLTVVEYSLLQSSHQTRLDQMQVPKGFLE